MDSYKYLFPYEKVQHGSRILIYGAGVMGQDYLYQMMITGYCEVIGMVDRNYEKYSGMKVPVYPPNKIHALDYDAVVIALQKADALNEILSVLHQEGVAEEKISYVLLRDTESVNLFGNEDRDGEGTLAYIKTAHSIAISVTGGIGDMVVQKRLISEIIRLLPDCAIDIYTVDTDEFVKFLYTDCESINEVLPNLGIRYEKNLREYSLALFIEGTAFIRVDYFNPTVYSEPDYTGLVNAITKLTKFCEKEKATMNTPMYALTGRRLFEGKNCYTWFSCGGAFEINDQKVMIPDTVGAQEWFGRTGLIKKKYITLNYGNGKCSDGRFVSKAWPHEYFNQLSKLLHDRYKDVQLVQLGTKRADKIELMDEYYFGQDFDKVACILKNSLLHIDIDGGLVHLASQIGTKCVVLFGSTPVKIYGYEQNINIVSEKCKECFGLYSNGFQCARGLEEPECMYSIKPEQVMEKITEYMEKEN